MEATVQSTPPLMVSRERASELLGVSVRSIDYLIADKRVKTRRIGKRVLITMTEINRLTRIDLGAIRPSTKTTKEVAYA
jgi:hypothetical protein